VSGIEGARQCTAKSKRSGERCKARAMTGREVCYMHGGKSLRGAAAPAFKNGRYSRYLPAALAERYEAALKDEELLELRREIALLDVRIGEVLGKMGSGETPAAWADLRKRLVLFRAAQARGPSGVAEMGTHLAAMTDVIDRGASDAAAWAEIRGLLNDRRKLVEGEWKRLEVTGQMVSAERLMVLLGAITDIIRRHIVDRPTLVSIAGELDNLIRLPAPSGDRPTSRA